MISDTASEFGFAQALVRLAKAEERESTPQAEDPEIVKVQEREAVQAEGPAGAKRDSNGNIIHLHETVPSGRSTSKDIT